MATFRNRHGKWRARVLRKGYAPISKSFTTRQDAERWARQIETEMDQGRFFSFKAQGYRFKKTRDRNRYNLRPKNTSEASVSNEVVKKLPPTLDGLFMKPISFVTVVTVLRYFSSMHRFFNT